MNKIPEPTLSIIIPCYNEKDFIEEIVDKVKTAPVLKKEIILIDDCSTDGTRELIKERIASKVDKVIYHEKNSGKGAALRSGIKAATGGIIIVQDADLEYNPQEYPILINPIIQNRADVVFGSRFIGGQEHRVHFFWHMIGNKFLTLLSNMFTNLNLTDMECCYKAFRQDVIQNIAIKENHFGFEPEITAKVAKLHCRIYEVGVSYNGRTYLQGKKITWKDGLQAIWCIIKYNLFH